MRRPTPQPEDPILWCANLALHILLGGFMGAALGTTMAVGFGSVSVGIVSGLAASGVFIALLRD